MSLLQDLQQAGITYDTAGDDVYVPLTDESQEIVDRYAREIAPFDVWRYAGHGFPAMTYGYFLDAPDGDTVILVFGAAKEVAA